MYITESDQLNYLKMLLGISGNGEDELLEMLLEMANNIALSTLYPYAKHFEDLELPTQYNFWVILAAKELYENKDMNSAYFQYSENGIAYTTKEMNGLLSTSLISQLIPRASVPQ
jgi:hypothetical protein